MEIVVAVSAMDLEKSKVRGDLGITYGTDTLRLIDVFRGFGFQVNSVVLTRYQRPACGRNFPGSAGRPGPEGLPPLSHRGLSLQHSS